MRLSRILVAPAAAAVLMLAQLAGGSPARASTDDLACQYDYISYNACLHFTNTGLNQWQAHVGLDAFMSTTHAQEIIRQGAALHGSLWGYDRNGTLRHLADLTVAPGWPSAGE